MGDDVPGLLQCMAPRRISIHIPRVGDDIRQTRANHKAKEFQSTSPVWGMTREDWDEGTPYIISIHIPRVGDDDT